MIRKKKFLSLLVCLMVVGLMASLISGCAGGNGGNGGNGGDGDDTPQYGGVLNVLVGADPTYFDDAIGPHYSTSGCAECLWSGDWTKGKAGGYGTGETAWIVVTNRIDQKIGYIAESYEIGDDYLIFNLRDGVHWHDKYPASGREVTADDVVFSIERQMTLDTAYLKKSYGHVAAAMSVSKVDEDTVRIDCDSTQMAELLTMIDFMYIYPQDAVELYGDMNDWENTTGTGAFTLEEYLPGSSMYYERNPDWWMTNPIGPGEGDQLPYIDGYNVYIQPDFATQDSLFRTGQTDRHRCDTIRAQALLQDLPDVEYETYFETANSRVIFMRMDKEDKPWADVRVRQAMQLAIDNQQLLDELYDGDGRILYWPIWDTPEVADGYVSLAELDDDMIELDHDDDELPTEISVADLWGQDLELAQALLSAAGYPDGFEAEILVYNYQFDLDSIQAVVAMLDEVGIELTLDPVDYASWTTAWALGSYDELFYCTCAGVATYFKGINWSGTSMFNTSNVDDPVLNDYRDQMLAVYPDENAALAIHAEMMPYLLEQCYAIQTVGAEFYVMWWPWVKNYNGEGGIGYYKTINPDANAFLWIDEDLKEDMGY
jgi:peptide/nickel transport system substrate-binding protein